MFSDFYYSRRSKCTYVIMPIFVKPELRLDVIMRAVVLDKISRRHIINYYSTKEGLVTNWSSPGSGVRVVLENLWQ